MMADSANGEKRRIEPSWSEAVVIAEKVNVQEQHAANVVCLLDEGATVPFIARYRREQTGDMAVEKIREASGLLEELRQIKAKISSVYTALSKDGKMTKQLERSLRYALTVEDVETLYSPFKPGQKKTLADRARLLGLEPAALSVLEGKVFELSAFVKPDEKGLANLDEVETGVQHIIADIMSKDEDVIKEIRKICSSVNVTIKSIKAKIARADVVETVEAFKNKDGVSKEKRAEKEKSDTSSKFEQYFNFTVPLRTMKPHQILAINRGEEHKVLTVKVILPKSVKVRFTQFAHKNFIKDSFSPSSRSLIQKSIEDSFDRLIQPQMCRHIRSEQTKSAEKASISVFTHNLRRLLLTPPVRGKTVLGIDPGFTHGCKCAVVSPTGEILDTAVVYLHDHRRNKQSEKEKIVQLVKTYSCDVVAVGNGLGCRQTEQVVANLIQRGFFHPVSTACCIVDEGGASIYSVSDEAQKELPNLDPSLRGAVSIARRLQDPLSELVKVEAKHIGVGMYQHDVSKTKLQTALDSVVQECVSFVGVDLNTASQCLLKRVAGLSAGKASKIIDWRQKHGMFQSRLQLLEVKGVGKKTFEQCAGFVRVLPGHFQTSRGEDEEEIEGPQKTGKKRKAVDKSDSTSKKARLTKNNSVTANPFDMTAIHPESYSVASRLLADLGLFPQDVGQPLFIEKVQIAIAEVKDISKLGSIYGVGKMTMKFILEALSQPINYDMRSVFPSPVFRKELTSIKDLKPGAVLTGRVTNMTSFGAFVDIGVEMRGLIHVTMMRPPLKWNQCLCLGDCVEVFVSSVDIDKNRICLQLKQVLGV